MVSIAAQQFGSIGIGKGVWAVEGQAKAKGESGRESIDVTLQLEK